MKETREVTCVLCPMGCKIDVEISDGAVVKIENAECARGKEYALQEVTCPVRDFFATVRISGGRIPVLSVRSVKPVPKDMLMGCASVLAKIIVNAPVKIGDTIVKNILNTGTDIVSTKNVDKA